MFLLLLRKGTTIAEENIYSPIMVFGTYLPTAFETWRVLMIVACITGQQNNFSFVAEEMQTQRTKPDCPR